MTNTTENTWTEPTAEQISDWKQAHGSVHRLKALDEDGSIKHAYMRQPGINDLTRAAASEKQKPGTYNQSLYENCVLASHPDVKAKPQLYIGMITNIDKIKIAAEVEVEKL